MSLSINKVFLRYRHKNKIPYSTFLSKFIRYLKIVFQRDDNSKLNFKVN